MGDANAYLGRNATVVKAGSNLKLIGMQGISLTGVALSGQDIVAYSQGNIDIRGTTQSRSWGGKGNRHSRIWGKNSDKHTRIDATASTLQGQTITLQTDGGKANQIALSHVDLSSAGSTRLLSSGDITIDPGASQ